VSQPPPLTSEERYRIVCGKDRRWDGKFVFAVTTTGIYCRPSCAARTPLQRNIRYFDDPDAAAKAGYRACKRCTPDQPRARTWVEHICRYVEQSETPPSLSELAQHVGKSTSFVQRAFKAAVGLSPRQYAEAIRHSRLRDRLRHSVTVTEGVYAAGYNSSGRFYADADQTLGMTPTRFRSFGDHESVEYSCAPCRLGWVLVARTLRGVCAVSLGVSDEALISELTRQFARAELRRGPELEAELRAIMHILDDGGAVELPLDIRGTAFQHRVWQALREIPSGQTRSYAEIAEAIGAPRAVRAVGSACAANRLAVIVPCHRAVRADGGLGGFRWGLETKRQLLRDEQTREALSDSVPPRGNQ
jgi:AraC family transcriptional regulator of adaptative response/methylated-DNA-[protein]-cysteine methyltransferase